jgi:TATA-binding protein-associated factor Taf7
MASTALTSRNGTGGGVVRTPNPSGLADVIDLILDKGLVIDIYVRVSLVGIELLTIDARIVVASVDTYLRFAEAVNRLDLEAKDDSKALPDMFGDAQEGGAKHKTKGALQGAKDSLSDLFSGDEDEDDEGHDEDEASADEDDEEQHDEEDEDDEQEERRPRRRRQPANRRRRRATAGSRE